MLLAPQISIKLIKLERSSRISSHPLSKHFRRPSPSIENQKRGQIDRDGRSAKTERNAQAGASNAHFLKNGDCGQGQSQKAKRPV